MGCKTAAYFPAIVCYTASMTNASTDREKMLTALILDWYRREGRRLPFRGTKDPYLIWVSEIMLQQTRTETVGAYYLRFIDRFPTVQALAGAEEQEVLKLWEGLGYYSRARNLHRAAELVVVEYGGRLPASAEALQRLPGIGPYTAAAIASIAFDQPVPAMDGNLQRVLSRLYLVEEDIGIPSVKRRLYQLGQGLMPRQGAGDVNQALMDIGATICLPGTPDCGRCPLQRHCKAYHQGEPELLPRMQKKKPPREVPVAVLLLTHQGRVLVQQRQQALLRGLYTYVLLEDVEGQQEAQMHLRCWGLLHATLRELATARHIFTHRIWQMTLYHAELTEAETGQAMLPHGQWVTAEQMHTLPFPTAMRVAVQWADTLLEKAPAPAQMPRGADADSAL
jgi:A/G-specific adenine glycosylase